MFPTWNKKFSEHFTIISTSQNLLTDEWEVSIVFDATPGKEYVFYIDPSRYRPDKESIAQEILRQLGD